MSACQESPSHPCSAIAFLHVPALPWREERQNKEKAHGRGREATTKLTMLTILHTNALGPIQHFQSPSKPKPLKLRSSQRHSVITH